MPRKWSIQHVTDFIFISFFKSISHIPCVLGEPSCDGIIGLHFLPTKNIFLFIFLISSIKITGDHQQLNIVYDAALLADAEKSAGPTIRAKVIPTKLSNISTPEVREVNDSSEKPPQDIKRRPSKPSVRF